MYRRVKISHLPFNLTPITFEFDFELIKVRAQAWRRAYYVTTFLSHSIHQHNHLWIFNHQGLFTLLRLLHFGLCRLLLRIESYQSNPELVNPNTAPHYSQNYSKHPEIGNSPRDNLIGISWEIKGTQQPGKIRSHNAPHYGEIHSKNGWQACVNPISQWGLPSSHPGQGPQILKRAGGLP